MFLKFDRKAPAVAVPTPAPAVVVPNPEPQERPRAPVPAVQAIRPEAAFGLSPEQYESLVENLIQMGYPRADVERALRACKI